VDPLHFGLPWAGVRLVLQCAINVQEQSSAILEGTAYVATMIYLFKYFEQVYMSKEVNVQQEPILQLREALLKLYTAILLFLVNAVELSLQPTMKRFLKTAFVTNRFQPLIKGIGDLEKEVFNWERIVQRSDGKARYLELRKLLGGYNDFLESNKRKKMLDWISTFSYAAQHSDLEETRLESSGGWMLAKPEFLDWQQLNASSLLWLRGDAGSGKTNLISMVISNQLKSPMINPEEAFAFYFCSRTSRAGKGEDIKDLLLSLLRQLSSPVVGLPLKKSVVAAYDERVISDHVSTRLTLRECKELILDLVTNHYQTTILIIDALDECEFRQRSELIKFLKLLSDHITTHVKILVSSRNDPDLYELLQDQRNLFIDATDNTDDIKLYVDEHIDKDLLAGRAEPELKDMVKKRLLRGAQGSSVNTATTSKLAY
jgi:hypothetical protein